MNAEGQATRRSVFARSEGCLAGRTLPLQARTRVDGSFDGPVRGRRDAVRGELGGGMSRCRGCRGAVGALGGWKMGGTTRRGAGG